MSSIRCGPSMISPSVSFSRVRPRAVRGLLASRWTSFVCADRARLVLPEVAAASVSDFSFWMAVSCIIPESSRATTISSASSPIATTARAV
ncbi:hypothetical protein D9M72_547750 [compost metagenome]